MEVGSWNHVPISSSGCPGVKVCGPPGSSRDWGPFHRSRSQVLIAAMWTFGAVGPDEARGMLDAGSGTVADVALEIRISTMLRTRSGSTHSASARTRHSRPRSPRRLCRIVGIGAESPHHSETRPAETPGRSRGRFTPRRGTRSCRAPDVSGRLGTPLMLATVGSCRRVRAVRGRG
jgi:hypothetical protein